MRADRDRGARGRPLRLPAWLRVPAHLGGIGRAARNRGPAGCRRGGQRARLERSRPVVAPPSGGGGRRPRAWSPPPPVSPGDPRPARRRLVVRATRPAVPTLGFLATGPRRCSRSVAVAHAHGCVDQLGTLRPGPRAASPPRPRSVTWVPPSPTLSMAATRRAGLRATTPATSRRRRPRGSRRSTTRSIGIAVHDLPRRRRGTGSPGPRLGGGDAALGRGAPLTGRAAAGGAGAGRGVSGVDRGVWLGRRGNPLAALGVRCGGVGATGSGGALPDRIGPPSGARSRPRRHPSGFVVGAAAGGAGRLVAHRPST